MGAASVDRQIARKRSRKRKERWPQKIKSLRATFVAREDELRKNIDARIKTHNEEVNRANDLIDERDRRIRILERNGPAVVEVVHVKQRGFFVRLWWALGFAFTRKLWFERIR